MNKYRTYYEDHLKSDYGRHWHELDDYDMRNIEKAYTKHLLNIQHDYWRYLTETFKWKHLLFGITLALCAMALVFVLSIGIFEFLKWYNESKA